MHEWPGSGPTVRAVHGITANGLSWGVVARHLAGRVTLLAPDLAGRAGSRDEPGPYGLARHADDVVALLDERGVERAVVAGHSMGGYVAALAAVRHLDRVSSLVMVDGGLSLMPPGTDVNAYLISVLGPAIARLERPSAIRARMSCSRTVSALSAVAWRLAFSSPATTSGSRAVPPAATRAIASVNSATLATRSLSR